MKSNASLLSKDELARLLQRQAINNFIIKNRNMFFDAKQLVRDNWQTY